MTNKTPRELIVQTLKEKSVVKQDVFKNTIAVFADFKVVLKEIAADLKGKAAEIDKRLVVDCKDKGEFEIELRIAGDVLVFYMHTNVFEFDRTHPVWKSSYVKKQEFNSFCGMINVYNFLNDSFKYNRGQDVGYMIARLFVNREMHYFVEGKRQLGFLYNDFPKAVINRQAIASVIESAVLYCLNFDMFTPPFESVKEVSVAEILEASNNMQLTTGKRLGFRFLADSDQIE